MAIVNLSATNGQKLPWSLAHQFGGFPATHQSMLALWWTATDPITENRYQHKNTVLLFDDAKSKALSQIARLAHAHASPENRLSIVLVSDVR